MTETKPLWVDLHDAERLSGIKELCRILGDDVDQAAL
jgi:hypothetical protein